MKMAYLRKHDIVYSLCLNFQDGNISKWKGKLTKTWPKLFEDWIMLSTGEITIQWISVNKTNHAICWITIYQLDSIIHLSNNPGQANNN